MLEHLNRLVCGQALTAEQAESAFDQIMGGDASEAQIGALLAMIQQRGATVDELTGAARVMRRKVSPVAVPADLTVIDTCGTGGDHAGTFNISTAAALVAAAAGRPHGIGVAKHGNRSVTSQSGSSQVLEALGVNIQVDGACLTRCLDEAGICFCFAPAHHPAMRHAMPVRLQLGFRTIFNLLGPLTNPAGTARQLVGVFDPALTEPLAHVLGALGAERAAIVHGTLDGGGLDELSTGGPTRMSEWRAGSVHTSRIEPAALGLGPCGAGDLAVDSPDASARIVRSVLDGQAGPARDIVCLNAGAALMVAGLTEDLAAGLGLAAGAIDDGSARATLQRLTAITQEAG